MEAELRTWLCQCQGGWEELSSGTLLLGKNSIGYGRYELSLYNASENEGSKF